MRALSTNFGPSAEPPIPIEIISVNLGAFGGRIAPEWTCATKLSMHKIPSIINIKKELVLSATGKKTKS